MNEPIDKINCQQKKDGKAFSIIAIFLVLFLLLSFTGSGSTSSGLWLARGFFLVFILLFFVLANSHHKKHQALGDTPLYLNTKRPIIGQILSGKIKVPQQHFTKVKQLTLNNIYYDGRSKRKKWKRIRQLTTTCLPSYEEECTWLNFEFTVPEDSKASENKGDRHFYWEVEMVFTEKLTQVKRNWRVTIDK
ncbi:hypothetical protein tinsulaeT_29410 [Thalassotalea insulae]|uniref:DUF4178 domain-containing protein n=1 Tax=Thalassotalea insulae TaxID=2056778 RepID=A0ABQ6GUI9_9GAMM|nr:hypothetical protein [Thalassotalea insulae]GLX79601.1 hypothetical protein tinsulaeT_29410 [Thalassotalea insulae]